MANLKIKANAYCGTPILISVTQVAFNSISLTWNASGMTDVGMTMMIQMSTDGGLNWVDIATTTPTSPYTLVSAFLEPLTDAQSVKFRIVSNSTRCGLLPSNVITVVWSESFPTVSFQNVVIGTSRIDFDMVVTIDAFEGYACGLMTNNTVNTKLIKGDFLGLFETQMVAFSPLSTDVFQNTPISLPIGTTAGYIEVIEGATPIGETVKMDFSLGLSPTTNFYDSLDNVEFNYERIPEA